MATWDLANIANAPIIRTAISALHAVHKLWCEKSASRLEQGLDFQSELVNGWISGRDAVQSEAKFNRAL